MTAHTILEVYYAFLHVFATYVLHVVGMAAVARELLEIGAGMAGCAICIVV